MYAQMERARNIYGKGQLGLGSAGWMILPRNKFDSEVIPCPNIAVRGRWSNFQNERWVVHSRFVSQIVLDT